MLIENIVNLVICDPQSDQTIKNAKEINCVILKSITANYQILLLDPKNKQIGKNNSEYPFKQLLGEMNPHNYCHQNFNNVYD